MSNKLKKVARTVYLSPDVWSYIDQLGCISERRHSQEIEHMIKVVRTQRDKANEQALSMAELSNPPKN